MIIHSFVFFLLKNVQYSEHKYGTKLQWTILFECIFMFQTLLFCVPKKKVLHMYEGAKMTEFYFVFIVYPIKIWIWSDLYGYQTYGWSVVTRS